MARFDQREAAGVETEPVQAMAIELTGRRETLR